MSGKYFDFKQFRVYHDQCAMKVGTDGVLLGALIPALPQIENILDVGTGSGLIALMCAQKFPEAMIEAVEFDAPAAKQAADNFSLNQWANRMQIFHIDYKQFESPRKYDLIVCNPPFFVPERSFDVSTSSRKNARYAHALTHAQLLEKSASLLSESGCLYLILPTQLAHELVALAKGYGLNQTHEVAIHMKPNTAISRYVLGFAKAINPSLVKQSLVVYTDDAKRSDAYAALCSEFYL